MLGTIPIILVEVDHPASVKPRTHIGFAITFFQRFCKFLIQRINVMFG